MKYLPIFFIIALFGCNRTEQKDQKQEAPIQVGKTGAFTNLDFGKCDTVENAGVSIVAHIWEPTDTSRAAKAIREELDRKMVERINSHADSASLATVANSQSAPAEAFKVFETNYKKFKKDFPDAPGCWEVGLTGDTVMVTPKVMMYQLDHYAFTGGAHPNSFRSYHFFDQKTGKERDGREFIKDSVALLKKVEVAFRKQEKLGPDTDLEEAGYFLLDHRFFVPANYTFTPEGVFFYYNPYEIAAYARGAIQFTIPYSELEGVVKSDMIF